MTLARDIVEEVVRRILAITRPDRIILFGSAATGRMTRDSDIDLLLLQASPGDPRRMSVRIRQALRGLGISCSIAVAEPSPFQAELAAQAGADHLIKDGDILGGTSNITGARAYKPTLGPKILMGGFSKIFDTVASNTTLNASMRALSTGGTLSVVGIGANAKIDLTPLWLKLQTIKGAYIYGYNTVDGGRKHAFELAIDLVKQKKVHPESMITHAFSISDYCRMIEVNLDKGRNRAMKTAVRFV